MLHLFATVAISFMRRSDLRAIPKREATSVTRLCDDLCGPSTGSIRRDHYDRKRGGNDRSVLDLVLAVAATL